MANNPHLPGRERRPDVEPLPAGTDSLARYVPTDVPAGTLCVLGPHGGVRAAPTSGCTVTFGRNAADVDVRIGVDDDAVSRLHGTIRHDGRRWRLRNEGRVPIRLPGSELLLTGHEEPLPKAYTPLFIRTSGEREHLLEVRVTRSAAAVTAPGPPRPHSRTRTSASSVPLADAEKLVLTALGQRYLRHETYPQPQAWAQVVDELQELQPDAGWTTGSVQYRVGAVRRRLAGRGVPGLTESEVPPPLGNMLNHNLIMVLLDANALVPPDLDLLEP